MGLVVKFREGPRIVTVLPDVNLTLDIAIDCVTVNRFFLCVGCRLSFVAKHTIHNGRNIRTNLL